MERIIKIAKNNVQVQTVYWDEKVNGKETITSTETYGQQKIDDERLESETKKAEIDLFDKVAEKAKEDVKLEKLANVQTILNE